MKNLRPFDPSYLKFVLMGGILLGGIASILHSSPQKSPNIIFILTDDQSWVGTSLQMLPDDARTRSNYYRTPNLERLAANGMTFSHAYAPAPFCCPTRRSLQIGQDVVHHMYNRDRENWTRTYRKQLNLVQMLKRADPKYQTAHFGKWDLRYDKISPQEMGYDHSDGITSNNEGGYDVQKERKRERDAHPAEDPKKIFSLTQQSCDFMEKQTRAGNPFFIQLSHYAVHLSVYYQQKTFDQYPDANDDTRHTMPEFAAMTEDLDTGLGLIIDKVQALGIEDYTYLVFMSDNGGTKRVPGQPHAALPRNHPLRGYKSTMYEGGIRIPLIIAGPDITPGARCSEPVSGLDLFPTFADWADYSQRLPEKVEGASLKPLLSGDGRIERPRPFLFFHHAADRLPQSALILGNHKLVKTWREDRLELFDLSQDLGETKNLALKQPKLTAKLYGMMLDYLEQSGAETRYLKKK
ncbi:MAG: Arylsulfatase [Opitutia bacterium UBA7350]|nr:MAG: Arylsulfatase [Opitutae bacterium UBA7350]